MKRYLVTLTGRANLGCKGNKLREHDLCYSYVFGKNKDEAISKFWEQISNCSGLKGFERRDFKITAERWEKDSFLDVNGDVVTDIEWAIPFDLLASLEMIHDEHYQNYHLAIPLDFKIEETTNQAKEDSNMKAQELADNRKPSDIIRSLWDRKGSKTQSFVINGKLIKTNFDAYDLPYWNGTDIPVKYTRENNGINYRSTKPRAEELDECIAQGFDEIRFVLCASGMIRGYCKIYVWAHKSKKAQELEDKEIKEATTQPIKKLSGAPRLIAEPVAQENIQPEHEDATESISEPQETAQGKNEWEISVFFSKDQILDELNQLKTDLGSGDVVGCTKRHEHQRNRYIKALEIAINQLMASEKPLTAHHDAEKEIAQENPQELTESNPEPLGDIKLSDFFSITEMLLMENSEPEWAYYHNNDLIWASSKRFSKDELLRMYANGYFMPYLTDMRKNLSRIQLKEYKTMGNTERCQNLWKQIEALDEEIARLFMNGARM